MGTLRIIAGELRGRRFRVPDGGDVRPTPDRVREALFSILGPGLEGISVLELYAGSGALGFEALSRGADRVTFVEADGSSREVLELNADSLGLTGRCRIVGRRAADAVNGPAQALGGPFDLVLADPPYADPPGDGLLRALVRPGILDGPGEDRLPEGPAGESRRRPARGAGPGADGALRSPLPRFLFIFRGFWRGIRFGPLPRLKSALSALYLAAVPDPGLRRTDSGPSPLPMGFGRGVQQ